MRLILLCIIFLLTFSKAFSQASDFVTVKKKNNRTLKTYFPGSSISCQTVYGNYINGVVQEIKNDSLFIKQYDVRTVANQWGLPRVDTLGSYLNGIYYKDIDIVVMPKTESFGFIKNGALLMIGGLGYAALNVVNGKYLKQSITSAENIKSLGIALGVAGAGYLMNRLHKLNNRNGRKYRVEYVHMNTPRHLRAF